MNDNAMPGDRERLVALPIISSAGHCSPHCAHLNSGYCKLFDKPMETDFSVGRQMRARACMVAEIELRDQERR